MAEGLPYQALLDGDPDERVAAARRIREAAAEEPLCLHGTLGRVIDALGDDCEPVRRDVANALFEVGVDEPVAVAPVAEAMVDALDDEATAVRACLARPIAELAAERPRRVRFAVDDLVPLLTDVKSVRYNAARTLAALAPRYPEVLATHVDPLTRALLDDDAPVQRAILRTLTPMERTYPGLLDVVSRRLQDLLDAEAPGVRQAACRAAGAADQSWVRAALRESSRDDPHPLVRETARATLTALTAEPPPGRRRDATDDPTFETATLGCWLSVRTEEETAVPDAVGRVTAIEREPCEADEAAERAHGVRRQDFGTRRDWLTAPRVAPSGPRRALHLHDPFREVGVTLLAADDGPCAEFTAPDRNPPARRSPSDVSVVSPDRARLLAARPGDRLTFELEGARHEVVVTTAGERDQVYRLTGENDSRGYRITFRPMATEPMMAVFAEGRAFRARNVQLAADE